MLRKRVYETGAAGGLNVRWAGAAAAIVLATAGVTLGVVQGDVSSGGNEFSRYEPILQRKPFGDPPPPPAAPVAAPARPAPPPGPSFVKDLRMCAIKQGRGGVYVGFLDVRAKPEKSYYLKVGDSEDGIDVLEADFVKEAVKLRKGGDEQWLYMDGRAADAPRGPEAPAAVAMAPALGVPPSAPPTVSPPPLPPMAMPSSPPSIVSPPRPPMVPPPTVAGSYAERLRKRREILEARRRADEAQPKLSGEDLQKQLQEYNLKLIRAKGALGPPLPIPLTPEQDAALVSEGVLPPQ